MRVHRSSLPFLACAMMLVAPSASAQASSDPSPFRVPPEPALPAPFPNVGRPEPSRKTPGPLYIAEQPGTVLLVTEYLGRPVHGPDKQKVGTISNLLVDISGRVTGFVIDVGGFLGIGAKEVAIAFDALYPVAEDGREAFLVEMKKEQLAAAPSFKRSR